MFDYSYSFFAIIGAFYLLLLFLDTFFKTCLFLPYLKCIKTSKVQINLFRISWFTTAFNRRLIKWGTYRPKYQLIWFNVGTWVTLCILPFALFFIVQSLYTVFLNLLWKDYKVYKASPVLEPVFPGINLPITDIGYYIITLLVCTIFHEVGHALAAVREGNADINGIGVVIMFVVPVCYVSFECDSTLNMLKQLRICCAGIWHNVVLSIFAIFTIVLIPWLLCPFYDYGSSVQVVHVNKVSSLYGPGGLKEGDIITDINKCKVHSQDTWVNCLKQLMYEPATGFCLTSEFVHEHDESILVKLLSRGNVECCRNSTSHLCFEYVEDNNEPVELPQYSCLTVRTVVHASHSRCVSTKDCAESFCLRPSLENSSKLIEINRKHKDVCLFLGPPALVYKNVKVSEFVQLTIFPVVIPEIITKFCKFLFMISSGFAVLNIVPCFYFDGHLITRILVNISLEKFVEKKTRAATSLAISIVGTFILVLYVLLEFLIIVNKKIT